LKLLKTNKNDSLAIIKKTALKIKKFGRENDINAK